MTTGKRRGKVEDENMSLSCQHSHGAPVPVVFGVHSSGQDVKHGGYMQTSEYTQQAQEFLTKHELEFRAVHVGNDCPMYCEDHVAMRDMDKLDTFPRKTHIHGHHYHVTISRKGKGHFTVDFWNSYSDEEYNWLLKNNPHHSDCNHLPWSLWTRHGLNPDRMIMGKKKQVEPYDVLACITKNDPGTFEDFCGEYGYDTDSRKAETIYFAVQKEWSKLTRFFTPDEIVELQEIN